MADTSRVPLLSAEGLKKYYTAKSGMFSRSAGVVRAVDGVSFQLFEGETLGLVGESGCGKSTAGRTILGLTPATEGQVLIDGVDVCTATGDAMHTLRKKMQIIFQDPYSSLDPRMTVYDLIGEGLAAHKLVSSRIELEEKVEAIMEKCGLFPEQALRFPHQFSGGQRQRISIARALAASPEFVVCDEAVSALDVSTQSQIINLLEDIQKEFGLTYLFISHGLSVVRHICSRVIVMYLGQVVEMAECEELYENPLHPYTKALFSAIPLPDPEQEKNRIMLEGDVPNPVNIPQGCAFHTRCRYATQRCRTMRPILSDVKDGHQVSCHLYSKEASGNKEENPAPAEV